MNLAGRPIDLDHPPYVIAEIGVNHDGSVEQALALVDAARRASADAIKLQLFETDRLLGRSARLVSYQQATGAADPFALLRGLELSVDEMAGIVDRAHDAGLDAIVTVFTTELVSEAERLPVGAYKTASTDLINRPLIEALVKTGKPLIVSTGAASLEEVARACEWLGDHPHVLMHCVSSYPTPEDDAALGGRIAMLAVDPAALGYSDHTTCLDTGALAVAGGACLLEKHLTHDRAASGPDHAASLEWEGLAEYVRLARRAWRMRGSYQKRPSAGEREIRAVSRQSLTATRDLPAGHVIAAGDLTVKRPGTGISPARLDEVTGRTLARPISADTPLTPEHVA